MKNNLGLKIFAVLVAVFIWLQVTLMTEQHSKVNLELRLTNSTPEDSLLYAANKISSQVQGQGMDILKLQFSKAYVEMDARDLRAGNDRNFALRDLPLNLDVTVLSVDPASVVQLGKPGTASKAADANQASRTETARRGAEAADLSEQETGADSSDPVNSLVLTNLPITSPTGLRFFPSTATLKVQGRASILASLPRGVVVKASPVPDARGFHGLSAETPEGVTLLDITPRQVRPTQ
ncbi:MAG: hypothetical protein K0B87_04120 [Candidatus Syntrophosphaera sp.]|nr:hypothetical protein [Candidatus Syntrophosphaera sp.]